MSNEKLAQALRDLFGANLDREHGHADGICLGCTARRGKHHFEGCLFDAARMALDAYDAKPVTLPPVAGGWSRTVEPVALTESHWRDVFAKAALPWCLAQINTSDEAMAEAAYNIADAMLAERRKRNKVTP